MADWVHRIKTPDIVDFTPIWEIQNLPSLSSFKSKRELEEFERYEYFSSLPELEIPEEFIWPKVHRYIDKIQSDAKKIMILNEIKKL